MAYTTRQPRKYLFVIQGEGNGHMMQAVALKRMLERHGGIVVGVWVGLCGSWTLPDYFVREMGMPVGTFSTAGHIAQDSKGNLCTYKSLLHHLMHLDVARGEMDRMEQRINESDADIVINFYEIITGLTYYYRRPKKPYVSIGHQYSFLLPDYKFPLMNPLERFLLKWFTRGTAARCKYKIALSMHQPAEATHADGITVLPPLLRDEIMNANPIRGNYVTGYILTSGCLRDILDQHKLHPELALELFCKQQIGHDSEPNLRLHTADYALFLDKLMHCKAYMCTAGFESVCEALYMKKPVMLVATQVEQRCNVHEAEFTGLARGVKRFDISLIDRLPADEERYARFRQWVGQAENMIVDYLENIPLA